MKSIKSFFEHLIKKALVREVIVYVIFGVCTTIVGFGTYALFIYLDLSVVLANTLSHLLAILFAYVTNKIWVFKALDFSAKRILAEFFKFLSSRLVTFAVDTLLLILLVDILFYDPILSKAATSVIVVLLNYFASKWMVFNKK